MLQISLAADVTALASIGLIRRERTFFRTSQSWSWRSSGLTLPKGLLSLTSFDALVAGSTATAFRIFDLQSDLVSKLHTGSKLSVCFGQVDFFSFFKKFIAFWAGVAEAALVIALFPTHVIFEISFTGVSIESVFAGIAGPDVIFTTFCDRIDPLTTIAIELFFWIRQ